MNATRWTAGLLACLLAQLAHAALIITPGPGNFAGDENILVGQPGLTSSGNPVEGKMRDSGFVVLYTSDEALRSVGSGQGRVKADDGGFDLLTLAPKLDGAGFTTLIVNLNAAANGEVTIRVEQLDGDPLVESHSIRRNGENFFRIRATDGQLISQVTFDATVEIEDVRQVRLGGLVPAVTKPLVGPQPLQPGADPEPGTVPEPGTLALLGLGLAGLAASRRRTQ